MPDVMSAASASPDGQTNGTPPAPKPLTSKDVTDQFRAKLETAKRNRKQLYSEWKRNVELRMGKIASQFTGGVSVEDEVQTEINPDWSLTKTKTANLFSQVPSVQGLHENTQYAAAVSPFMKSLNYEIGEKRANLAVAMEEVMNDVVNAAGVGAVIVGYAARFEDVEMIVADTLPGPNGPIATKTLTNDQQKAIIEGGKKIGQPVRTKLVPRPADERFYCTRVSPVDLLWPAEFTGSDFDDSDWLGRTGRCSWSEAINDFKKDEGAEFGLTDDDKDKVLESTENPTTDTLTSQPDKGTNDVKNVRFDELFYWRYRFDPAEKCFDAIWRIVFVQGKTEPVRHEPWKGQEKDEQTRKYLGSKKFPIRVLTLTYITDNAIPPSDSSAGRPQVNDMRRSRSQMFQNRERSIPIRGFDVNRVDPLIGEQLMAGTWQGMIPFNGSQANSIWEVARASYPAEDFSFDAAAKADLMESWQIGPNQQGTSGGGRKTSAESQIVQQNFATRIGQERNRVAYFFLGICQVLAGLMVLYSDFPVLTEQERQAMEAAWDRKHILHDLVMKIRPDSTIVLDTQVRVDRLMKYLNMVAKSGFVNVKPIVMEITELMGLDPNTVVIDPQPKKPDEPNISLRLTGKDDLINPMVIAFMIKLGVAPTPENIEAAKVLLSSTTAPELAGPGVQPGLAAPGAPGLVPPPTGPAGVVQPHHADIHTNTQMTGADKIVKRSRDMAS